MDIFIITFTTIHVITSSILMTTLTLYLLNQETISEKIRESKPIVLALTTVLALQPLLLILHLR